MRVEIKNHVKFDRHMALMTSTVEQACDNTTLSVFVFNVPDRLSSLYLFD